MRASALFAFAILAVIAAAGGAAAAGATANPLAWLKSRNYPALERYYSHAQRQFEAGKLTDRQLYARFRKLYQDSAGNERYFDGWVSRYPHSYPAEVARGAYLYRMAWSVRGNKYRYQTTARQFTVMRRYLARARSDLLASLKMTGKPYLSALYLLNVAILDGTFAQRQYWLKRGDAMDPANFLVRLRYMFSLRPRWGGSYAQMNQFLRYCTARHLDPRLIARMAMLIHSDRAEDAMRTRDTPAIFQQSRDVLRLAVQAHRKAPVEFLVAYTVAAWDLHRKAIADWGLRQLSTRHLRSAWSLSQISWVYAVEHHNRKAWPLVASAAGLNDPWSQFAFGETIYRGCADLDLPANPRLGLLWIRRSANQCFADADGFMRVHGHFVPARCPKTGAARSTGAVGAVIALLRSIEISINQNLSADNTSRVL